MLLKQEQQNEILEKELQSLRAEIKINQNRLEAFQSAFISMNDEENEEDDDEDDEDEEDDDEEVDYDSETINNYETR